MALVSSFNQQNETSHPVIFPLHAEGLVDNYALRMDEPDEVRVSNKTTPIDQPEVITFQYGNVKRIPTKVSVANPVDGSNVMYGVRVDEINRTRSTTDDSFTIDDPIVVTLSIKHPITNRVKPDMVFRSIMRCLSALVKDSASADTAITVDDTRIKEMMSSALRPTVN
jgi:hypothetical protein